MMKKCFPATSPFLSPFLRLLAGAALSATGLSFMMPAHADANLEPLTNILSVPGSAGLGVVTHFESSPYREAGNRYDVLPLYLYEGERFFLHANRGGAKLKQDDTQRFDLFVEQRLEGFPADRLPDSLAGMATRDAGIEIWACRGATASPGARCRPNCCMTLVGFQRVASSAWATPTTGALAGGACAPA